MQTFPSHLTPFSSRKKHPVSLTSQVWVDRKKVSPETRVPQSHNFCHLQLVSRKSIKFYFDCVLLPLKGRLGDLTCPVTKIKWSKNALFWCLKIFWPLITVEKVPSGSFSQVEKFPSTDKSTHCCTPKNALTLNWSGHVCEKIFHFLIYSTSNSTATWFIMQILMDL